MVQVSTQSEETLACTPTTHLLEEHLADLGRRLLDSDAELEVIGVDIALLAWRIAQQGLALRRRAAGSIVLRHGLVAARVRLGRRVRRWRLRV